MSALTLDPVGRLASAISEANEVGLKIQSATADKPAQIKAILATSEDEKIVKFRAVKASIAEQIETLQAKLENGEAGVKAYIEKELLTTAEDGFDVETAKKDFAEKRAAAHTMRKALLNFVDEDTLNAALLDLGVAQEVVSIRGTGVAKGSGTGVRRPRISAATFNGENVEKDGKVDFTLLGKVSKTEGQVLKDAAFAAAGTDDLNSLEPGTVVEFEVGENKFSVTISAAKTGRKRSEDTSDEVESDEVESDGDAA